MSFQPIWAVNGQALDTGRRRQGEADWRGRKAVHRAWATVPLSWLVLVNQAFPPEAYLPFSDLHSSLFSSLWREGLLSQQLSIVWDEFVRPGDFTRLERGHWSVPSRLGVGLWATWSVFLPSRYELSVSRISRSFIRKWSPRGSK